MDIEYLLFLQNFRENTNNFFSPLMDWVTKFAVSFWLIAIVAMIYWAFDRKAGKKIIFGWGGGLLINGFLKLTFCVYRPWIRDARIEPWGDAKVAATGYSFPSGHSTYATAFYGGIGMWQRKKYKIITVVMFLMIALTMISRNYLGVHTPQDVLVGLASTALMMYLTGKLDEWTDKDIKRDLYVILGCILIVVLLVLYYNLKPYPLVYLEDGSLLVDPAKMMADSYEGIGFMLSFSICRYFERRLFDFENLISWKMRFSLGLIGALILGLWCHYSIGIFQELVNRSFGKFIMFAGMPIIIMIIVPWLMEKVAKCLPEAKGK